MVFEDWITVLSQESKDWLTKNGIGLDDISIMQFLEDNQNFRRCPNEIRKLYIYPIHNFCNSHVRVHKSLKTYNSKDEPRYRLMYDLQYDPRVILQLMQETFQDQMDEIIGFSKYKKLNGDFMRSFSNIIEICGGSDDRHIRDQLNQIARPYRPYFEPDDISELNIIKIVAKKMGDSSICIKNIEQIKPFQFGRYLDITFSYTRDYNKASIKERFTYQRKQFLLMLRNMAAKSDIVAIMAGIKMEEYKAVKIAFGNRTVTVTYKSIRGEYNRLGGKSEN